MFSIIVPVYNKLPHLERSISSVLNQTFTDFELILIDDASTDGSADKIRSFNDPRIRILHRDTPGPGGYAARNLGIRLAKYDWISFLDADDAWHPEYLSHVYPVLMANSGTEFITVGWEKLMDPRSGGGAGLAEPPTAFTLKDYLLDHRYVWTGAVTVSKALINRAGLFPTNENCKRGGDVDTWIRCLATSRGNIKIDQVLAYYYQDTVNRVTDSGKNPSDYFCAYDTLMNLYRTTEEKELKPIIRNYINIKIFQILQRNPKVQFALIAKMFVNAYSIRNVPKLIVKKLVK